MNKPTTENFHEMVIEVEKDPQNAPGIYTKICGLTSNSLSRSHNMNTTEVPADCDDESLPAVTERAVQSSEVTLSGSGVWSSQSHGFMLNWWYSGKPLNVQITNTKAVAGDTSIERGSAYLVSLNNSREKGQKVTAEIEMQFDGLPARIVADEVA